MKKVISYSLWGDNPKYTVGAVRNAEIAKEIYPDWICYFFISEISVPKDIVAKIENFGNSKIFMMSEKDSWANMFWRFATCYDDNVDVSIFRDTDSRLSYREKFAVDEWLKSNKTFHIMRDHPYHSFPILGGMWGFKANKKYPMQEMLTNFNKDDKYGTDYEFFITQLYPLINDDKIVHDPFFDKTNFPTSRNGTEFVGDVFDEQNMRHPEFYKVIP